MSTLAGLFLLSLSQPGRQLSLKPPGEVMLPAESVLMHYRGSGYCSNCMLKTAWGRWTKQLIFCRYSFMLKEKVCILIQISNFCSVGPCDNMSALVQVMAWHQSDGKPFCTPMVIHFTHKHICSSGLSVLTLAFLERYLNCHNITLKIIFFNENFRTLKGCVVNIVL